MLNVVLSLGPWGERELGNQLFDYVNKRMFSADHTGLRLSPGLMALLQASCCLGNQHAPLLLATVHLAGLAHPADQEQVETTLNLRMVLLNLTPSS